MSLLFNLGFLQFRHYYILFGYNTARKVNLLIGTNLVPTFRTFDYEIDCLDKKLLIINLILVDLG